jgi:hypothetical protein
MKREALFTTKFRKWLEYHIRQNKSFDYAAAIEVKVTTKKSIPFGAVKKHQVEALRAVKRGVFIQKIPDAGWQNPFDLFALCGQKAYVVLAFLEARKPAKVWFVDIDVFIEMQDDLERRSLNEETLRRAERIFGEGCQHFLV